MKYFFLQIKNYQVFFRVAGNRNKPPFLLIHGFPSSSFYFKELMKILSKKYYVIAPDLIGFGYSSIPSREEFKYTFDNEARILNEALKILNVDKFYMYLFDWGVPLGFRLAIKNPNSILGIVIQNGSIYKNTFSKKREGLKDFWKDRESSKDLLESYLTPEMIFNNYAEGNNLYNLCPDGSELDVLRMLVFPDKEIYFDLMYDYKNNESSSNKFRKILKKYSLNTLVFWGMNDSNYVEDCPYIYDKDIPESRIYLEEGSHFLLETKCKKIGKEILKFFDEEEADYYEHI